MAIQYGTDPQGNSRDPSATGRYASYDSPVDTAESTYMKESQPESQSAISSRISQEFSGEISSIKSYYDSLLAEQKIADTSAEGKTRATASAEGNLGSEMGNEEQANQRNQSVANEQKIVAEEGAAEQPVQETIAGAVEGEVTSERTQGQTAAQNDLTFQQNKQSDVRSQIQTVAGQYDLSAIPQDEYDKLFEASGFTSPRTFNAFYQAMRTSALTGGKTLGDATSGVWQQGADGTWKQIIQGTNNTIGDPTSGVWVKQADGTYKNVIPAALKTATIGSGGSYVYSPTTGAINTVKPTTPKIITSGGIVYAVDPTTNNATPLTTNSAGWNSTSASADNEKAAIMSYVDSLDLAPDQQTALLQSIQTNPQAYFTALGNASQSGFYTNVNVGAGTTDTSATDAAANAATAATDAADAAANSTTQ